MLNIMLKNGINVQLFCVLFKLFLFIDTPQKFKHGSLVVLRNYFNSLGFVCNLDFSSCKLFKKELGFFSFKKFKEFLVRCRLVSSEIGLKQTGKHFHGCAFSNAISSN